jgi:hypothetical protein
MREPARSGVGVEADAAVLRKVKHQRPASEPSDAVCGYSPGRAGLRRPEQRPCGKTSAEQLDCVVAVVDVIDPASVDHEPEQ